MPCLEMYYVAILCSQGYSVDSSRNIVKLTYSLLRFPFNKLSVFMVNVIFYIFEAPQLNNIAF